MSRLVPIYMSVEEAADTAAKLAAQMEQYDGQVTESLKSSFRKLMKGLIFHGTPYHCTALMEKWADKLIPKE
jgi:hypothetical protein